MTSSLKCVSLKFVGISYAQKERRIKTMLGKQLTEKITLPENNINIM